MTQKKHRRFVGSIPVVCKKMNMFYFGWQLLNIAIKLKLLVIPIKNTNCRSKIIEFYAKVKISEIID